MSKYRWAILPVMYMLSFAAPVYGEITQQDKEECLALGQIAGSVVIHKTRGVPKESIWLVYEQQGVAPQLRPVIEALAEIAYNPELSGADAGDFVKYVVQSCLEDRENLTAEVFDLQPENR